MIESISISDVATFDSSPQVLDGLSNFNFFYGSNGSGKTTISRVINNEDGFSSCKVNWKARTKLDTMVYNQDFIEKNFNQADDLKGVFTLGEKHVETLKKIKILKEEIDKKTQSKVSLKGVLEGEDGHGGELSKLQVNDLRLTEKCWERKKRYDEHLSDAFIGYRNNKEKFKDKILQEEASNTATLEDFENLVKRSESIFGSAPTTDKQIDLFDAANLIAQENNQILTKKVIGKEDVDIASLITKLGNSDWVRQGRKYFDASNDICPFCQQTTPESLVDSLNEYFDEAFINDNKAIDELFDNYRNESTRYQEHLESIISNPSRHLDAELLEVEKDLLEATIVLNLERIGLKKKEPSHVIELESISEVHDKIQAIINSANERISKHNEIVANLTSEKKTLSNQVWKCLIDDLKDDLKSYKDQQESCEKAIKSLREKISEISAELNSKNRKIRELEKQTTSIQPTINEINRILSSFGFEGFKLDTSETGNSYKLVRQDGSDAKETLSEGEKTFVTFLYFYHLLKGTESDTGRITEDRVVVFDDPVSSLDSDVLFIVGSLIKGLFQEVRDKKGHIKQIFVLTHNVYFHKEVTYNSDRREERTMNEETFWTVRKNALKSTVKKHGSNPIKTSYELLWQEVRDSDRSNLAIQNTLRRILENYFKILGNINFDQIVDKFDGKDKIICRSLISWVHDGSHYAHDDLYVSIDSSMVDRYLEIFQLIFIKSGQHEHYKMMMGDAFVELPDLSEKR